MVYIKLQEFLLLKSVQKAKEKLSRKDCLAVQIRVFGLEDKILITTHNVEGQKSSKGFKLEKITNTIFAILPKNLILLKN